MSIAVTDARADDLEAVAAIYAVAADTSSATFDLEGRPDAWWQQVHARCDARRGHLLLVARNGEEVVGFAKSGLFRDRAAYDTTVETSVYVAATHRRRGVGRELYAELLRRLEGSDARLAVAGMTEPNAASAALHGALGFTPVGTFHAVGVKFGQAWDVTWYERPV